MTKIKYQRSRSKIVVFASRTLLDAIAEGDSIDLIFAF